MSDELKPYANFGIGDEVCIHGYVDKIRRDTVIIRNDGGYFGTVPHEVTPNTRANDNLSTDNDISADSHACNDTKMADSRERLEADIKKYRWEHGETSGRVTEWLNRQAAITRAEVFADGEYDCMTCAAKAELREQVEKLTAERDELRDIIAHMPKTEQECESCQEAHDRLMFNAKVDMDELRDKLDEKQRVIDTQRDSFAKMERECAELRKMLADAAEAI